MEEQFFFTYHLRRSREEFLDYPINERKWIIARFLEQKEREEKYIESAKKKKSY